MYGTTHFWIRVLEEPESKSTLSALSVVMWPIESQAAIQQGVTGECWEEVKVNGGVGKIV